MHHPGHPPDGTDKYVFVEGDVHGEVAPWTFLFKGMADGARFNGHKVVYLDRPSLGELYGELRDADAWLIWGHGCYTTCNVYGRDVISFGFLQNLARDRIAAGRKKMEYAIFFQCGTGRAKDFINAMLGLSKRVSAFDEMTYDRKKGLGKISKYKSKGVDIEVPTVQGKIPKVGAIHWKD